LERAKDIYIRILNNGEPAIDDFILTRKSEGLFIDFKRSENNGDGEYLQDKDKENLAKAISAFGNSEGGVIVWGISCSKVKAVGDVPDAKRPIKDVKRFVSWLEGAVSGCTIPPHNGVRHGFILSEGDDGFAITYVPKSQNTPHQTVKENQYYIRAGSSSVRAPHAVLQGMFGKRPQPLIQASYQPLPADINPNRIRAYLNIYIENLGPGIADDLYFNLTIKPPPSKEGLFNISSKPPETWRDSIDMRTDSNYKYSVITKPEVRMAPEQSLGPISLAIQFISPFDNDFNLKGLCGCGQSAGFRFQLITETAKLERIFEETMVKQKAGELSKEDRRKCSRLIYNLGE